MSFLHGPHLQTLLSFHELVILPRTQLSSSVLHLRLCIVCCSRACLTLLNPGGYFANLSITFSTYSCFWNLTVSSRKVPFICVFQVTRTQQVLSKRVVKILYEPSMILISKKRSELSKDQIFIFFKRTRYKNIMSVCEQQVAWIYTANPLGSKLIHSC